MRYFLIALLTLGLVGAAAASMTDNTHIKISVPSDPGTPDGREGGETVDDAMVIPALPFNDTGNTSDNVDDYDEVCPYTGSLSADVVYAFTPAADGAIDIDICESLFDTKLYVYENVVTPGAPYACNDDADCATAYRSALPGLAVTGGNTYYIVIDGYGSDMGDYILNVTGAAPPPPPCDLVCPAGGVAEGEPTLADDYSDDYNGGCNSSPAVFQTMDFNVLCGISGWYLNAGSETRDTDWFSAVADAGGYITMSAVAEQDLFIFVLGPLDCNSVGVVYQATCTCEVPGVVEFAHPAGTETWLWAGPTTYSGPVNEFDYILTVDGIVTGTSAVNDATWGDVKNMFK
jgi:hypothetical protein